MVSKVIVYMAEWCPWCHTVMDFLKKNNIQFEAKNVDNKEYAKESMEKSKQTGIPVTDIDGKIVVGYDVTKLKEYLKI